MRFEIVSQILVLKKIYLFSNKKKGGGGYKIPRHQKEDEEITNMILKSYDIQTKKYISLAEFQYRFYRRDAGCCELKRKLKVASAREDQRALTPARFPESTLPLVNNIRRSIFTLTGNIFPFKYNYYYFCQNQKTKKILYFSFGKKRNKTFVVVVFVF